MAEPHETVANAGEQASNAPPTTLALKPEDQFRQLHQRLENLATKVGQIAEPPRFRLAETLQLVMIAIGLLIALVGAFSLTERISDLRTDLSAAELRLKDGLQQTEIRLTNKLDKLGDQFSAMDERTSRLEGELQGKESQKPK